MREQRGNEAAAYLEFIANSQAAEGWEFYRVDEVGVLAKPGCLGALFGRKEEYALYYVVTFRRSKPVNDKSSQKGKNFKSVNQAVETSEQEDSSRPVNDASYLKRKTPPVNQTIEASGEEELKFCYHCGADLPEKTKTCPECGKPL